MARKPLKSLIHSAKSYACGRRHLIAASSRLDRRMRLSEPCDIVLKVEIADIAAGELSRAFDWYEEREAGLGDRLLAQYETAILRIRERPSMFPRIEGSTRRALLRRFPYGVFFRVLEDRIVVSAFFHAKREPSRRLGR
jgi:plasmid stabilization system protein ParE